MPNSKPSAAPETRSDVEDLPELKGWFLREFGGEVVRVSHSADSAQSDEKDDPEKETPVETTPESSPSDGRNDEAPDSKDEHPPPEKT